MFTRAKAKKLVFNRWRSLESQRVGVMFYIHQQGETLTFYLAVWLPPNNDLTQGLNICNT